MSLREGRSVKSITIHFDIVTIFGNEVIELIRRLFLFRSTLPLLYVPHRRCGPQFLEDALQLSVIIYNTRMALDRACVVRPRPGSIQEVSSITNTVQTVELEDTLVTNLKQIKGPLCVPCFWRQHTHGVANLVFGQK